MREIVLSTGKLCPRCGQQSLEQYYSTNPKSFVFDKLFQCVALCGMDFGLRRKGVNKIEIGYDEENEVYLTKRFNIVQDKRGE